MKCLNCGGENFEIQNIRTSHTVNGMLLDVIVPCHICTHCNTPLMNNAQLNLLRRAASDLYREKKDLLTSKQIIQFRENLQMSQLAFANYLKVGESSIKRWETYYIQEDSQDNLMRVKCDLLEAEKNYFFLNAMYEAPDIYNGHKKFSLELFDNVASYLLHTLSNAKEYLKKLHFYVDFLHYKMHQHSLTGIKYIPLKHGPSPCLFTIFSREEHSPYNPKSFKQELFDDQEIRTLDTICQFYNRLGPEKIVELCTKEKGYIESKENSFISYEYASSLLL